MNVGKDPSLWRQKMKSIIYRYPQLYDIGIRFIFFDGLKILKDIVGKKKHVFEPACGYGRLKKYLYPDCIYSGIDLNETFIKYGKKKKRDIYIGNALDKTLYPEVDTILFCDFLHHLKINEMHQLVSNATQYAREKIVIIEPIFVDIASKDNLISRIIAKLMSTIDSDGINTIDKWLSKQEYDNLFQSFLKLKKIKDMKYQYFRKHVFVEMILK